jgi:PAS domain S-box-containing protein
MRRKRAGRTDAVPSSDTTGRLVDHAQDVVFRVQLGPRPKLQYISPSVLSVTGYPQADWFGQPELAQSIVHRGDRRKLRAILGGQSRRVLLAPFVLRFLHKMGFTVFLEIRVTPVHDRRGTMTAMEGIARDITATRISSGREPASLRAVVEEAPCGILQAAMDGRFLHVNSRMCEITGYAADELLARHLADITHPDDRDVDLAFLQRMLAGDVSRYTLEKRYVRKDRGVVWVRVHAAYVRGASGAPLYAIGIVDTIAPPDARANPNQSLEYSGIEMDADRLDVRWNSRPVALTLKEVLLLRYFIRHRGEMLPRDRLLHDVWGYKYAARSRTLDVHVCRLRRKLPPLSKALITIGHFGYTLSLPDGDHSPD